MTWKDFEAEAEADASVARSLQCGVCKLLDGLPKEGRRAVEAAFANRGLTSTAIRRTLARRLALLPEHIPSAYTFNRHRRGDCGG